MTSKNKIKDYTASQISLRNSLKKVKSERRTWKPLTEQRQPTGQENIFVNDTTSSYNSTSGNKQHDYKMGLRTEQIFFQRGNPDGQQAQEKMFNITNHQRNARQKGHNLMVVRMAIMKKNTNNKCWHECGEKGTLLHRQWGLNRVQSLWKTVRRFLKTLKTQLPYVPAIPLLGIYLKKTKALI